MGRIGVLRSVSGPLSPVCLVLYRVCYFLNVPTCIRPPGGVLSLLMVLVSVCSVLPVLVSRVIAIGPPILSWVLLPLTRTAVRELGPV